eukprot:CAMPEP_0172707998 /NCGR_PEP_ID=MMETSP1074-20121228/50301_1 /TAXON_ID=2916 /ORGANISM="Ceratium fusus, Strain PA161109" /LENGTH=54 /DNA_ID=CAMNT_0013530877 /DNA_START=171 /DNA_END=332 /DNA_ORIENTATION=+
MAMHTQTPPKATATNVVKRVMATVKAKAMDTKKEAAMDMDTENQLIKQSGTLFL